MALCGCADVVHGTHLAPGETKKKHLCLFEIGTTTDVNPGLLRCFMERKVEPLII